MRNERKNLEDLVGGSQESFLSRVVEELIRASIPGRLVMDAYNVSKYLGEQNLHPGDKRALNALYGVLGPALEIGSLAGGAAAVYNAFTQGDPSALVVAALIPFLRAGARGIFPQIAEEYKLNPGRYPVLGVLTNYLRLV